MSDEYMCRCGNSFTGLSCPKCGWELPTNDSPPPSCSDPIGSTIRKLASAMMTDSLKGLPENVDDWTEDDKLIAQNLCHQYLDQNDQAQQRES